ncbi:RagB/SusD family nutrient uptake outer membrane protein [Prevotella dentasini]|uniref:RagB/SusD family nutrient uptake outer membrane protein n=1 Tax=Prevotella dentasini TaxID=589537 RepID=UPI00278BC4C3|nr:RagB/SusD family nutrient uptake outer membrane protein [Prevotella dentasini]
MTLSSCNDYLDKLPDDRVVLDKIEKFNSLLVSAYPQVSNNLVMEMFSDNVADNGRSYETSILKEQAYRMQDIVETGMDSPRAVWNGFYNSVATATEVLDNIRLQNDSAAYAGQIAEAKLCRAYSMFQLANTFCMAWNPDKADEYLGLPYLYTPETNVNTTYTRGTLRELYANINRDIEEALPAVDESYFATPKYHFNKKAAYAFAARFNLYYMQYDKCIEYANLVLGSDPLSVLRPLINYKTLGRKDFGNLYVKSSETANLLLLPAYSLASRFLCTTASPRFLHNSIIASYETIWVDMPWGTGSSDNTLLASTKLYGNSQGVAYPKLEEFFEYTDKVNGSGYVHIVDPEFTTDETLLCRAEAYALTNKLDEAVADLNFWVKSHCEEVTGETTRPTLTKESIKTFVEKLDYAPSVLEGNRDRSMRKKFNPQGFTVAEGEQEDILQFVLHMRRLETLFQGMRFMDLKRYGIEYSHRIANEDPIVFKAGDLRGAIQLPADVINAGLAKNPR